MRFTLQASRRSLAWKVLGQSAQLTHSLHSSTSPKPKINWQSKEHCCTPSESGQFLVEGALGAAGAVYTRRGTHQLQVILGAPQNQNISTQLHEFSIQHPGP